MQTFGIYIHIPFCRQKCFYCDFPSFAGRESKIPAYLQALEQELYLLRRGQAEDGLCGGTGRLAPATIYIGGGTPSVLSLPELKALFDLLGRQIDFAGAGEITLEVNPGTAAEDKLQLLKEAGVTRLSVGVQSFDDGCLQAAGRIHTGQEAEKIILQAQELGFADISLDLMYGLPRQTLPVLEHSLAKALSLGVQHISIYGLQLEPGTAFARMQEQGRLHLPDDALTEAMYDCINETLPAAGYHRYEISNFALRGHESRHNLSYWQDVPYLGIGSGAHSYWQGRRCFNQDSLAGYMEDISRGKVLAHIEENMTAQAHMEEYCFLALRTACGISAAAFQQKFRHSVHEVYGKKIAVLAERGLLRQTGDHIALTDLGMKFGNQVFGEFLL